jgi:hypothetical protein
MLAEKRTKYALADNLQAQVLRQCLEDEHRATLAKLSKHRRVLNQCLSVGAMRTVSHHRGRIRELERELWSIKQMVDAMNRRFPLPDSGAELD